MAESKIQKVILIVLDGFGLGPPGPGNPVTAKNMPFVSGLISTYKSFTLVASGLVVGLEWGICGNSEVGHGALGTGRVVVQALARIDIEIKDKKFFRNDAFVKVLEHARKNNSKVHLVGCVSPGGIHSHEKHLIGLLEFFAENKFTSVCVHMITDGEDSGPKEGIKSLEKIQPALKKCGAKVVSVSGRNYAMDRVKNWLLTKKVWDVMVRNDGGTFTSPEEYIKESYKKGILDPEIVPAYFVDETGKGTEIDDGDGMIFFNFRNDRVKQLVAPFVFENFKEFKREKVLKNVLVATMTNYDDSFAALVAYRPGVLKNTLGEVVSNSGLTQIRLAEGEKGAHVTNFFNGGKMDPYPKEDRLIVTSRALSGEGYLKHPEMSVPEVTEHVLKYNKEHYALMVVNFASSDMIAHTGNMPATVKALSIVDKSLEQIMSVVDSEKTVVIITADHGNAEEVTDPVTGEPDTQHSTSNVPVIFINDKFKTKSEKTLDDLYKENPIGSLIDVAPTVLSLLDIPVPKEMTGSSIIK